jgi:hypothetical protein
MAMRVLLGLIALGVALVPNVVSAKEQKRGEAAADLMKTVTPVDAARFKSDAATTADNPFTHLDFKNDPEAFQFVIVSDNTGGARTGVFNKAVGKINLLQPEFVVSVGDLIEGYSESPEILASQWAEFEAMTARIEAPFFYTPGNHDYSNNVMADLWKKKFGRDYYYFVYRDVLFLVLNTERQHVGGAQPTINPGQRDYIAKALAEHPKARWTFLFMHQPVWSIGVNTGWADVEKLLAGRPFTAIAGHMHTYAHVDSGGRDLITLGTTGGGSQLRGEAYGEFDHVTWVTMKKDGPAIANIRLDGITDKYVTAPGFAAKFDKIPTFALEPWFLDTAGKPAKALRLIVTNPFSEPINFSVEAPQNAAIRMLGDPLSGQALAGQTTTFDIPVALDASVANLQPLELRAKAEIALGEREVAWSSVMRAAPATRYSIARTQKPILYDGDISEWGALQFAGSQARAASGARADVASKDASFRFDARYDDTHLYVAVDVTDDEVTPGLLSGKHDAQDLVILTLDPRPMAKSATNQALTTTLKSGDWIFIMGTPNDKGGERLFGAIMPPMFEVKMKPRNGGYTAEFRVPLAFVQSKHQGGAWTDVRLNVSINDIDPKSKPDRGPITIGWQPDWREQIAGTGTFFKQ